MTDSAKSAIADEKTETAPKPQAEAEASAELADSSAPAPKEAEKKPAAATDTKASDGPSFMARLKLLTAHLVAKTDRATAFLMLSLVLCAALLTLVFIRVGRGVEFEEKPKVVEMQNESLIPATLTSRELFLVGQAALDQDEIQKAERYLAEAQVRASATDTSLTLDVLQLLIEIANKSGNSKLAELYREQLEKNSKLLGPALLIFNDAERHFARAEFFKARKLFARFLLNAHSLGEKGGRYIESARLRVASIDEELHNKAYSGRYDLKSDPEGYFRD